MPDPETRLASAIRMASAPTAVGIKVGNAAMATVGTVERGPGARRGLAALLREVADEVERADEEAPADE